MAITFELPGALQPYARGSSVVPLAASCATVAEALHALSAQWPGVVDRVLDERGELRPHVNLFVDNENIRFDRGLESPVKPESTIFVVAAVSGG
jgi:molybdopterin synthase sulfur carrier subunit